MRKNFLILSALLTVVLGTVSLQSCSSDDSYATEEYGYYTEEENNLVRAMAEKYGLSVELNEGYCGAKRSLAEIEEEMKGLSSLLGKHELKLVKKEDGKLVYSTVKDDSHIARTATRTIEGSGFSSGSCEAGDLTITVSVSWNGNGIDNPTISGTASISHKNPTSHDYSSGSLSCSTAGDSGISFTGWVSYTHCEKPDYEKQKLQYALYQFTIDAGQVSTTSASGSFNVTGGETNKFETDF